MSIYQIMRQNNELLKQINANLERIAGLMDPLGATAPREIEETVMLQAEAETDDESIHEGSDFPEWLKKWLER